MRFGRTIAADASIPTASTADIAFLLLIFFMATTIFRMEQGLPVVLPRAEMGVKIPRLQTAHIYVDRQGRVSIDDLLVQIPDILPILAVKLEQNPQLVVGLTIDEQVPYETADRIIEELKKANALNSSFTVQPRARESGP